MPKFLLIHAGPTPWDEEDRVSGDHTLPLSENGRAAMLRVVDQIADAVTAVYRPAQNEACDEAAKLVAQKFRLRPRDNQDLDAWNLGLWQGLRRDDIKRRFPSAVRQWEESAASVLPPEGESFEQALTRLRGAVVSILRRNRQGVVALVLRPLAVQMVAGILRHETAEAIGRSLRLQNPPAVETIELDDVAVGELLKN